MSDLIELLCKGKGWEETCAAAVSQHFRPRGIELLDGLLDKVDNLSQAERELILLDNRPALRMYLSFRYPHLAVDLGLDQRILVAVYGTLVAEDRTDLENNTKHLCRHLGIGLQIPGLIYNIRGEYPGLLHGGGSVHAEAVELASYEDLWATDRYEEYLPHDPFSSEYLRGGISASGLDLWVYWYNFPVNADDLILGGDWRRVQNERDPA